MTRIYHFLQKLINDWRFVAILCLTLGLEPWFPPKIWEKIVWLSNGAAGMNWIDWLDLVIHAIPWLLAIRLLNKNLSE